MKQKLRNRLLVACTLGALLALTWHVLLEGPDGTLVGRFDIPRYFVPQAHLLDVSLHRGTFPEWNPFTFTGAPYSANPQSGAVFLPNLVRSALTFPSTPRATVTSLVAMWALLLLVAGMGAHRLARVSGASREAAMAAAVVFLFSALMVRRCGELHFLPSVFVVPWVLVSVRRLLRAGSWRVATRHALGAGLLLGLGITGGFLQVILYIAVAVVAYAFFVRALEGRRSMRLQRVGRDLVLLAVLFALAAAAAACLLLPLAQLGGHVARQSGETIALFADLATLTASDLWKAVLLYPGPGYAAEGARAAGIGAFALAIAGVVGPRARRALPPLLSLAVLADCAFGDTHPFGWAVKQVSPFSLSAPARALDVGLVFLGVLAALGVDAIAGRMARRACALRTVVVAAATLAMLVAVHGWLSTPHFLKVGIDTWLMPAALLAVTVVAALRGRSRVLRLALVALLFLETFAWTRHYVPWLLHNGAPTDVAYPRLESPPFPRENSRGVDHTPMRAQLTLEPVMNGYDPVHLKASRGALSAPPREHRYQRIVLDAEPTMWSQRGNHFLKRRVWLARQVVHGDLPSKQSQFPVATTAFLPDGADVGVPVVARSSLPRTSLSEQRAPLNVTVTGDLLTPLPAGQQRNVTAVITITPHGAARRHAALFARLDGDAPLLLEPRVKDRSVPGRWSYGAQVRAAPSAGGSLVEIPLPDYGVAEVTITLKAEGKQGSGRITELTAVADQADEDALLDFSQTSPDSFVVQTGVLPAPRLLVIVETAYPGFVARVDGEQVHLVRVNDAYQGVALREGKHIVEIDFNSGRLSLGVLLSLVATLAASWAMFRLRRARAKPAGDASDLSATPSLR